jgi:hypothetical protein
MKRYDELSDDELDYLERRAQNIARIRRQRLAREGKQHFLTTAEQQAMHQALRRPVKTINH